MDILGKRGEQAQLYFHQTLSSCTYFCFEADELMGSGVPLRKLGRSVSVICCGGPGFLICQAVTCGVCMALDPSELQGVVSRCGQTEDVPGSMQELIDEPLPRSRVADVESQEGGLTVRANHDSAGVRLCTQEMVTQDEPDCLRFEGGVLVE